MKKIIATWAAIAFAATLTSCEMKKEVETNEEVNSPEINMEMPWEMEEMPAEIMEEAAMPAAPQNENPKMKIFEEKQAEMWKLFQEFEKNTPEFKTLQDEINAIFTSWEAVWEEQMKKVEEIDWKIRDLFTPEMKALDEELRQLWNEVFWQQSEPAMEEMPAEIMEENMSADSPETAEWEQPMMILK